MSAQKTDFYVKIFVCFALLCFLKTFLMGDCSFYIAWSYLSENVRLLPEAAKDRM